MRRHVWKPEDLKNLFPEARTLKNLVLAIEDFAMRDGEVLCQITVNDMVFDESDEGRFAFSRMDEIQIIEAMTESVDVLLVDTIGSASEYVLKLREVSLRSADLFRSDDLAQAQKTFDVLIDGASWVIELVSHIRGVASEKDWPMDLAIWQGAEESLRSLITQLMEAFERRDFVMVADLLEYDWTSGLDLWLKYLSTITPGSTHGRTEIENTLG